MKSKKKNSTLVIFFLLSIFISSQDGTFIRSAEGKRRAHIPDDLDDVIDDEEDEAWKEWGKTSKSKDFDPPPDLSEMDPAKIQAEMMKWNTGPSIGFVKLKLGVRRSPDVVSEIAMKWTKVLKTGAIAAKFMAVDTNTIMFNMEKGQDTEELKDFIFSQPESYEIKIGDYVSRRPGDPPLEEVIDTLHQQENEAEGLDSMKEPEHPKDEF
ncbi:uncharacterized protein LOC131231481 [Magnolia sinica]|uniref:uncharacterized protein LOC131231481 n=1 Tax=Magnolia sinica TaxID=86752 RepID=UPI00265AF070|nr:uncharacterized protein LOC131231481 [Magnolia sinica]